MNPPRLFSSTTILLFSVTVLLPLVCMVVMPFTASDAEQVRSPYRLFESRHLILARNSLALAGGTAGFCAAIGVPLAFLLFRTDLWRKRFFTILYLIPFLIPSYIHAIVWTRLDHLFQRIFSVGIHTLWGAIFVLTLSYFPIVTLTTLAALKSLDRNLEEASLIIHGKWKTLRRITLPLASPHIISGAILVFIFAVIDFSVPDILRIKVYPVEIFIQFSAFYDEGAAVLMSLPLIGITLLLVGIQKRFMKGRSYVQLTSGAQKPIQFRLGKCHVIALCLCTALAFLSVGVPVAVLLKAAGPLATYVKVLRTSFEQIWYSFVLAFAGAAATLMLGFSLSYLIERWEDRFAMPLAWAAMAPFAVPATCLGISLIYLWNRPVADWVYASSVIIVLGYVARFIPHAVLILTSGLKQLAPQLEEAAHLAVPRWSRVLRKIVLPLSGHSLITALFIVFILCFGELGMTLLVMPPGRETIPIKIYNLMHYGADQMVAALCLILVLFILLIAGGFLACFKKLIYRT